MAKKPTTVEELARLGGLSRAKKYPKKQLREWAKLGGRPRKLTDLHRLQALLRKGKSQEECAEVLGISLRTVGRAVAKLSSNPAGVIKPKP
jgi:hypothetical protein